MCIIAERSARDDRGVAECQRNSTYDYIEDYHVVPSARKNQYLMTAHPIPPQQPRSESPYQDMNSAKLGPAPPQPKTSGSLQNPQLPLQSNSSFGLQTSSNGNTTSQHPNNDMHVTPGGSVVYRSRGSASSSGEGDYTTMQSPKQQELARHSVTLPENALPYNGQSNGEYKFTEY